MPPYIGHTLLVPHRTFRPFSTHKCRKQWHKTAAAGAEGQWQGLMSAFRYDAVDNPQWRIARIDDWIISCLPVNAADAERRLPPKWVNNSRRVYIPYLSRNNAEKWNGLWPDRTRSLRLWTMYWVTDNILNKRHASIWLPVVVFDLINI